MKALISILLSWPVVALLAQTPKQFLQEGDKEYQKMDFLKADNLYEKALKGSPRNVTAQYNLGNTKFRIGKNEDAIEAFKRAANLSPDKLFSAKIYYNLGVVFVKSQKFHEAVIAFKNSLKLNPLDNESRENLQLVMNEIKKRSESKQQSNENKQQPNSEESKDQQQSQQKPVSKQNAEQILNALQRKENNLKDSLRLKKSGLRKKLSKDW